VLDLTSGAPPDDDGHDDDHQGGDGPWVVSWYGEPTPAERSCVALPRSTRRDVATMKVNVLSTAWSMTAISSPPVRQVMMANPVQSKKYQTMMYGSVAPRKARSTPARRRPALLADYGSSPTRGLRIQPYSRTTDPALLADYGSSPARGLRIQPCPPRTRSSSPETETRYIAVDCVLGET
jgi:hypothetical protein